MRRPLAVILVIASLAGVAVGCAKRQTNQAWPEWKASPLTLVSESRDDLPDGKVNIKVVVRGDATPETARDFLRDYVGKHRPSNKEMWVSLFLQGMDVQSIEYAFAVARPGERVRITVRPSSQTYR